MIGYAAVKTAASFRTALSPTCFCNARVSVVGKIIAEASSLASAHCSCISPTASDSSRICSTTEAPSCSTVGGGCVGGEYSFTRWGEFERLVLNPGLKEGTQRFRGKFREIRRRTVFSTVLQESVLCTSGTLPPDRSSLSSPLGATKRCSEPTIPIFGRLFLAPEVPATSCHTRVVRLCVCSKTWLRVGW